MSDLTVMLDVTSSKRVASQGKATELGEVTSLLARQADLNCTC